jgi:DNA anti-recombination protein RmuC
MDFIHRLVSQDQKNQNYRQKKLKTWIDQLTEHPHTNHTRTKLQTTEQQTWTHTYINTWSQKTQVAKNDTPTHKSQSQKDQNTNTEQQIWKNTRTHIHTDLEHTRDNKTTRRFGNRFCFRLQVNLNLCSSLSMRCERPCFKPRHTNR